METPYLVPLGSFFLWWISDREKNIHFVEDLLMNIPAKLGSTSPVLKEKKIKMCKVYRWQTDVK